MDGKLILLAQSMNLSVFMDGKLISRALSMNLSVFMDGKQIVLAQSMNLSVFMDGPSFQGKVEQGNRLRKCLQGTSPCSSARKQPKEQANHHQKRLQGTSPCSILPEGEEKKSPAVKLSAGNRKQGRKKRKLRSSIVSVPKPPRLPPWRAGRRRCPCRRDGPGGSGVSRRNGRPGR